jgi:hypothetical protein
MRTLASLVLAVLVLAPAATRGAEAIPRYELETKGSTAAVKQGGQGKLVVVIRALDGWHVDPRTPLKIELSATDGLKLAKTRLGKADAVDAHAESPRFEAAFTAVSAGTQEARAKVDFFVCSADACVKQVKDLAFPVTVN